jgi:arylsulfatase A-like enzyme
MLAIASAWGPRIPPGTNFGKIRSIDIVPTVLDLLELERPADLPGRSLVPPATLLIATPSASFSTKHLGAASPIVK